MLKILWKHCSLEGGIYDVCNRSKRRVDNVAWFLPRHKDAIGEHNAAVLSMIASYPALQNDICSFLCLSPFLVRSDWPRISMHMNQRKRGRGNIKYLKWFEGYFPMHSTSNRESSRRWGDMMVALAVNLVVSKSVIVSSETFTNLYGLILTSWLRVLVCLLENGILWFPQLQVQKMW